MGSTIDFRDTGFMPKEWISQLFAVAVGVSLLWLLHAVYGAWKLYRTSKTGDQIEDIVDALKSESLCAEVDIPIVADETNK